MMKILTGAFNFLEPHGLELYESELVVVGGWDGNFVVPILSPCMTLSPWYNLTSLALFN